MYLNSFVLFLKTLAKRTSHVIGWFQPELTNQIFKAIVALQFALTRELADYIILRYIALYETTFSFFVVLPVFLVAVFILPLFVNTCAMSPRHTFFLLVFFFSFYLYFKLQFRRGKHLFNLQPRHHFVNAAVIWQ